MLKWYTVIGLYEDNKQKFCDHVQATSPLDAERLTRTNPDIEGDLLIVAVLEGKLTPLDSPGIAS